MVRSRHDGGQMPKYIATGGATGEADIEIAGKTYSAGDTVELVGKKDLWLVEQGYLKAQTSKQTSKGIK
jgi:hypothetical protein